MSTAEDASAKAEISHADIRKFQSSVDLDGDNHVTHSEMMKFGKLSIDNVIENRLANGLDDSLEGSAVLKEFLMSGIQTIMKMLDTDKSGTVNLEEYNVLYTGKDAKFMNSESQKFHNVDTNNDDVLNQTELALLLFPDALYVAHKKADTDADGKLSYDEMTADLVMTQFSGDEDDEEDDFLEELEELDDEEL